MGIRALWPRVLLSAAICGRLLRVSDKSTSCFPRRIRYREPAAYVHKDCSPAMLYPFFIRHAYPEHDQMGPGNRSHPFVDSLRVFYRRPVLCVCAPLVACDKVWSSVTTAKLDFLRAVWYFWRLQMFQLWNKKDAVTFEKRAWLGFWINAPLTEPVLYSKWPLSCVRHSLFAAVCM